MEGISERLKAEMQRRPAQEDSSQLPAETTGRRLQKHHLAPDGVVTDTMLQEMIADHDRLHKPSHGAGIPTGPQKLKNPTSWTQWCEKNRETPEIVPGSGLVRAHFFMSGSACE